jgi:hypothetical protein
LLTAAVSVVVTEGCGYFAQKAAQNPGKRATQRNEERKEHTSAPQTVEIHTACANSESFCPRMILQNPRQAK